MDIIANDLPRFQQDISDYDAAFQSLQDGSDQLTAHMNDLSRMWEGEAHDQLMETFSADQRRVDELRLMLNDLLSDLRFAHTEYTSCENDVAGIIESIQV